MNEPSTTRWQHPRTGETVTFHDHRAFGRKAVVDNDPPEPTNIDILTVDLVPLENEGERR